MTNSTSISIGLIIGAILVGGGGFMVYQATRGIRNNNPGNIRYDGTAWQGLASPPSDGTFCVFTDPVWGIRALAHIIQTYVAVDGIPSTVTAIISRYAPPSENDTVGYITDVDDELGLSPLNDSIDLSTQLSALVTAIIRHENTLQPYSAALIQQGVALA
jgi:hypothetical protein